MTMTSKLIINADDFGYSRAVNYGIIDTHTEGILTSATLMANMPGFDHACQLAKQHPTLGVGVHLVLTCGKPILQTHQTLVKNGYFLTKSSYLEQKVVLDFDEIQAEWNAQIQKVYAAGIQPTHLDSHHFVHAYTPELTTIFLDLARKYSLPVRQNTNIPPDIKTTTYFEKDFDTFVAYGIENKLSEKDIAAYLKNLLEKITTHASTELMTHPAYIDEAIMASALNLQRLYEVKCLIYSTFAHEIKNNHNIELIHFGQL